VGPRRTRGRSRSGRAFQRHISITARCTSCRTGLWCWAANDLHCDARRHRRGCGKHVLCEKPYVSTWPRADRMIEACPRAKVKLMYARNCASPPSTCGSSSSSTRRARHDPPVKQCEKARRATRGLVLGRASQRRRRDDDMGCHAIEFFRWLLGGPHGGRPPSAASTPTWEPTSRGQDPGR